MQSYFDNDLLANQMLSRKNCRGAKMSIITNASSIVENSINLCTRKNTPIDNVQCFGISQFNLNQISSMRARIGEDKIRAKESGVYNCHGLVFASRRAVIEDPNLIRVIIKEDGYKRIEISNVSTPI